MKVWLVYIGVLGSHVDILFNQFSKSDQVMCTMCLMHGSHPIRACELGHEKWYRSYKVDRVPLEWCEISIFIPTSDRWWSLIGLYWSSWVSCVVTRSAQAKCRFKRRKCYDPNFALLGDTTRFSLSNGLCSSEESRLRSLKARLESRSAETIIAFRWTCLILVFT